MKDNKIIGFLVLVAIVIAIFYFLPMLRKPECKFDSDCNEGYVCSMDGKCILADIVDERTRDDFCPDNDYPKGMYDPDCPRYCPAPFERTGSMTMCCYEDSGEDEMAISVDCDTGVPLNLFPEVVFGIPEQRPAQEWYDMVGGLQALVSFVPGDTSDKSFKYVDRDVGIVPSITTGAAPEGASGYIVWLDSITVKSKADSSIEPVFQGAWNACLDGEGNACIGKAAHVLVPANKNTYPSPWGIQVPKESVSNILIGNYLIELKYCGTAYPETLQIPQICDTLKYSMSLGESILDFHVSANIDY